MIASVEQKAAALAALQANGGNRSETARQCGVSRPTLIRWIREQEEVSESLSTPVDTLWTPEKKAEVAEVAALVPVVKLDLSDRLEALAHTLAAAMPDQVKDAGLKDTAVALGIAVDKMRLLREQPTAITDGPGGVDGRTEALVALLASLRARRAEIPGRPPGIVEGLPTPDPQ